MEGAHQRTERKRRGRGCGRECGRECGCGRGWYRGCGRGYGRRCGRCGPSTPNTRASPTRGTRTSLAQGHTCSLEAPKAQPMHVSDRSTSAQPKLGELTRADELECTAHEDDDIAALERMLAAFHHLS
eukprot:6213430-Pleurochrysis_carterae.AAC.3